VIDPRHLDRQVTRALACIDRVAQDLGSVARTLHLGIYHERPDSSPAGRAGAAMLASMATGKIPAILAGWPYLSYPQMRVEIEAIVALGPPTGPG
jgi:enamine deaminase RidA (YjgF/YER057c/UK114 family)